MGSDGTLGLRAIKEKAGVVFVQDAGLGQVRRHAPQRHRRRPGRRRRPGGGAARQDPRLSPARPARSPGPDLPWRSKTQSALEKVFILLRAQTGHDFSLYKKSTIYRRDRAAHGPPPDRPDRRPMSGFCRRTPRRLELLFKELLIGVTSFFRDPAAWEQLQDEVIPALLAAAPGGRRAAGLGARLLDRARRPTPWPWSSGRRWSRSSRPRTVSLQIFATDLDRDAIDKARAGVYPANIAADVSPERLRRFFVQEERGYRVGKEIREMVVFAPQNVIMDPPFTKLDLLICRNLLIYLDPELQKKLLPLFHYSLNPGGVLFLGSAETIGAFADLFAPLDGKTRLYRRLDDRPGGRAGRVSRRASSPLSPEAADAPATAQQPGRQPPDAGGPAAPAALLRRRPC